MLCAWLMVTTKALLMLGFLCGHREGTENLGCPAGWKAEHVLLRASAWVFSTMTTRFLCRRLCPLQLVTCILDFTSGRQICIFQHSSQMSCTSSELLFLGNKFLSPKYLVFQVFQ